MDKTEEFMKPKMTFGDALRFTPYVWAKILWMRDRGHTEVAGYCTTGTQDPLLVTDFRLIKQKCTGDSFDLDTEDMAEDIDRMLDIGLPPWSTHNILCHTHPGNSPHPSQCDETNFEKAFSHPNWAIMFILANGGNVYCRIKINVGPGVIKEIDVYVDWKQPFSGSDVLEWEKEYKEKVTEKKWNQPSKNKAHTKSVANMSDDEVDSWIQGHQNDIDIISQGIDKMESEHDETDDIDCFWDSNGEVVFFDNEGNTFSYDPVGKKWYVEEVGDVTGGAFTEFDPDDSPIYKQIVEWAVKNAGERLDIIITQ